jgi:hypothetical protein
MFALRIGAVLMIVICFGAALSMVVSLDHRQIRSTAMNLCDSGVRNACL